MINFNFTAWIPFWPGRVDLFQQTQKAGDDKQVHRYRHWTSFDWIWDSKSKQNRGVFAFKSFCFMEKKKEKKKSDGENVGMHVKALHLFELQSGISIDGTH